ncbi:transglutaminaseTgpA domain-containing protein [Deinococcus koreensis]|uniref:DUF58 domain-containing protein n=1 Tax=Deinococcus koreensis TaxID=2054903 RepID=A0A2K3UVN8_9DEIO|nr:transglutaminaseTgpA domain-containing protein [Deinococcus koreensis]PNY80580.1 DUF58 domain-containing protein [Deinococcus koreensis]
MTAAPQTPVHQPPGVRPARLRLGLTQFGTSFLVLVLLTLIGCVNYDLSLGYGLTFLLAGVWVVAAAQALQAARRLRVSVSAPAEATAGQDARFTLRVSAEGRGLPLAVIATTTQGDTRYLNARVPDGEALNLSLRVPARVRGPLGLSGLKVGALDTLALWQVNLTAPALPSVLVQPAPEEGAPPAPPRVQGGPGDGGRRTAGDEEFSGLRPYAPGDSPRQVSWRHVARTGTLLTRETDAPLGSATVLDWEDTAGAGELEARLSRLAAWITQLRGGQRPFALNLPGETLSAGSGDGHAQGALNALARFTPLPQPPERREHRTSPPVPLSAGPMRATLLALAFALAPAALRQPWWITALIVGLLLHTDWRVGRGREPLPTWGLGLVAGLSAALLGGTYGTLLGRDAGTALLALLAALKTAESTTRRDANLLVLLGLFVTSTQFFFSQGPLTALHTVLAAWALLAAAARWTVPAAPGQDAPQGEVLAQVGSVLALAAPLALTLFVLFPRPAGPLWTLALQGQATTGLADEITAGEFSDLAQSRAVAFRADFQGPVPPPEQRYWRGPVYEAYDGQRWGQVRQNSASASIDFTGPVWSYTLTLEPTSSPWVPALDVPARLPEGTFLTTGFQAVSLRPLTTRRRLTLESRTARLGIRENEDRLRFDQSLPPGESPRALALAAAWRALPPEDRVGAGLDFLRGGGFSYTLSPPRLPERNRVDAFLFGSRQGFCEHYASAFVFLMRAAGLPARIVGGYLGGEQNPDGGYLIVRQQDAHAWAEVWLPGQGWVRVDPTALIAPARVNAGLQTALTSPQATVAPARSPLARLQLRLDGVQSRWNDLVIGYDDLRQQQLLGWLGLGGVGSPAYLLALPILLLLALLPALWLRRQLARPRDPAARALHDLSVRLGVPRGPGETASAYALRVRQDRPHLSAGLDELVRAYHAARYAPPAPGARGRNEALVALKSALRRIRR